MSLDKSIAHGKEHRKSYRGAKAIDQKETEIMREIYRWQLDQLLKYNRKIHIYSDIWLVSLYATKSRYGLFKLNFYNFIHYPLTFIFVSIRVKESDA